MTSQVPESILHRGRTFDFRETPLDAWAQSRQREISHTGMCSALWRGYVGTWAVIDRRLRLVALRLEPGCEEVRAMHATLAFDGPAAADWFSGTLVLRPAEDDEVADSTESPPLRGLEWVLVFEGGRLVHEAARPVEDCWLG